MWMLGFFVVKAMLRTPFVGGATHWTMHIKYTDNVVVSHSSVAPHLSGIELVNLGRFSAKPECFVNVPGSPGFCVFHAVIGAPKVVYKDEIVITSPDYDFSICAKGVVVGAIDCNGRMGQAVLKTSTILVPKFDFALEFVIAKVSSLLQLEVYHKGKKTHEGYVNMPEPIGSVLPVSAEYDSEEGRVSYITFSCTPQIRNFTHNGNIIIQSLTDGYNLTDTHVDEVLGNTAMFIKEDGTKVQKLENVREIRYSQVSVVADKTFVLKLRVHKPEVGTGVGKFLFSILDSTKKLVETGLAIGLPLTPRYKVKTLDVEVAERTPNTQSRALVGITLYGDTKYEMVMRVDLHGCQMPQATVSKKDSYIASGFEMSTIVGRN
eukprot:Platyproteum_vivax@DN7664_c0_g1_i7.p1